MTREEHITRAMLLNLKYVERGNYYVDESKSISLPKAPRFDGDTLEPITWAEANERLRQERMRR